MAGKTLINTAHGTPGNTALAFSRDGAYIYTGGADCLGRIWKTDHGTDQDPDAAMEAGEAITCVASGNDCWFTGSEDSDVRRYTKGKETLEGMVTSATGVAIRSLAVDPKGTRIAVSSDETSIKVVDLKDTNKMIVLKGHTKAVRRVTWHPSGSLLTSCGADGKIIVWDVSEDDSKQVTTIDGIIPAVSDPDSPEWTHDCSALWHTSGQHFYVATRTHELASIARADWSKAGAFSDDACSGAITALALSPNGVYVATASKSGVFVWATHNRRLMYRFQGSLAAPLTQLAWSPTQNLLAWTDADGGLTRWAGCVPPDGVDPVKLSAGAAAASAKPLPPAQRRAATPDLFDFDLDDAARAELAADPGADDDDEEDKGGVGDVGMDDDWILDDLGGGMDDEEEKEKEARWGGGGVREMVSVTKAQPAFQPGSTPLENKKRYLAYNMVGVVEVTDQDTHHIVNVEFHDRSARKGYHFTDHFKYDLAALGERGAVFACPPETAHDAAHPAHVLYKPHGAWGAAAEWTYTLPAGVRALGVAAGGAAPPRSASASRGADDADVEGSGYVALATSAGELVLLTGGGVECAVLSLPGEFVAMVGGPEWVFVVLREGSTTMDGSQNLTGRLIMFEDYCLLQKDTLPIRKGHTLKWIGVTEEGAPAIYDSEGILNILPRFRVPFQATWIRALDTNTLERKEGKQESYWPVGVSGDTFMCLILKGRQEHPGFPRPLIQELPLRLPFKRPDTKEGPLEEAFARESMLLDILRDALAADDPAPPALAARSLALDKTLVQLIQHACKADQLPRALDLAARLHHAASFDMARKVAGFYHLVGLQEKLAALRDARAAHGPRRRREERIARGAPVPPPRPLSDARAEEPRARAFQDFRPPPAIRRPGLERAGASGAPTATSRARAAEAEDVQANAADEDAYMYEASPDGKRKRGEEAAGAVKRRATDESVSARAGTLAASSKANPFARKADAGRNPFAKSADANKSLHKSESFFTKVDAAESDKAKRPNGKGKAKEKEKDRKEAGGRQTTLFGLPPGAPADKKAAGRKKKGAAESQADSQTTALDSQTAQEGESQATEDAESQDTDVVMVADSQRTEPVREETQATEMDEDADADAREDSPPIEWPESPAARHASLVDIEA